MLRNTSGPGGPNYPVHQDLNAQDANARDANSRPATPPGPPVQPPPGRPTETDRRSTRSSLELAVRRTLAPSVRSMSTASQEFELQELGRPGTEGERAGTPDTLTRARHTRLPSTSTTTLDTQEYEMQELTRRSSNEERPPGEPPREELPRTEVARADTPDTLEQARHANLPPSVSTVSLASRETGVDAARDPSRPASLVEARDPSRPASLVEGREHAPSIAPASRHSVALTDADRRSMRSSFEMALRRSLPPSVDSASAVVEEYEMEELHHGPLPEHRHPDNHIRTIDGGGFALSHGRILSWNNGTGTWDMLPQRDIVSIRLGADGHGYACTSENKLLCLTGPRAGRASDLTAGPIFNASPTGHIASVAPPAGEGLPATIRVTQPPAGDEAPVHTAIALPPGNPDVHALAYSHDGHLHLLTTDGRLWQTRPALPPETAASTWRELPTPGGVAATSLFTLPKSNEVGVCDEAGGNRHLLEQGGRWTPLPDDARTGLQRTYGQFRYNAQKFTNVTLGSPFTPGAARSDKAGLSWWQSKMAVFTREVGMQLVPRDRPLPENSLMERYMNYFMAHYMTGPKLPRQAQLPPDKQLREEFGALLALPPTTPAQQAALDRRISEAMHTNASMVLDRLERALGITDAEGNRKARLTDSKAVRTAQHRNARTDENMLYALLQRRKAFLAATGNTDPLAASTTERLEQLVDAGVHLQRPLPPHASRNEMGFLAWPALAANATSDALKSIGKPETQGLDVLVGKLVSDQLCFERAAQRAATTEEDIGRDLARLSGSDGNLISRRFQQNIWDVRAEAAFDAMRNIIAAFGQERHVLNRAARFQGMLGTDKERDYVRMVNELPPGEELKFEYTVQVGLDGDGWSHNWTPADRFKEGAHPDVKTPAELEGRMNIPMNKVPNILPVPSGSISHTRSMTITKRTDGVDLTFSNAYESEVKLLCAKIKWGAGEYRANTRKMPDGKDARTALGLVFFGAELVASAMGFSAGRSNNVTISLNNDEKGTVQDLLQRLLSGQLGVEELLDAAANASYTRKKSTKWTNTLDIQGLIAVVGIFTPKLKLDERLKLVAAIVEQWTASFATSKEESRTQDAKGITHTRTQWGTVAGLNRKIINVTEIQGSWLKALPAVSTMLGKTKDIIIGDGYEMEHKLPTWIDLQFMELVAPEALYHVPTTQEMADGSFAKLSYNISTKGKFNFDKLPHWEELARHSPEIADNLRGAAERARAQGLAVNVEMELVPEALEAINAARPEDGAELHPDMALDLDALMRHPASWRPTRLVVTGGEQYSTALVAGASAGRYKSHAGNTHQANLALIEIAYDDSNGDVAKPLGATVRGPLTNGGGEPQFDQLDVLAHPDTVQMLYGVLDERKSGPRRRLAALPPTGADADGLRQLRDQVLTAPTPEPHLALASGELVLQYQAGGRWHHVELNEDERQQVLGRQQGVDTAAVLQLMHASASGRLEIDPGGLAGLAGNERARWLRGVPAVSEGRPSSRPLAITAQLGDAARLESALANDALSPAQQHVLASFFPGEDGAAHALAVAQDADMMSALSHAVGQSVNEALAESAPHDTPETESRPATHQPPMMATSGALASASA